MYKEIELIIGGSQNTKTKTEAQEIEGWINHWGTFVQTVKSVKSEKHFSKWECVMDFLQNC